MPDSKISALTAATFLDGGEEFALAQGGANEKATVSQVLGGAFVVLQSAYTLTSTTASQKLFNATTNGALTLTTGIYRYEALIQLTSMSATSGNASFSILGAGTATLARPVIHTVGTDNTTTSNPAAQNGVVTFGSNITTNSMVTAGTGTAVGAEISGIFDVTSAGTIIPSTALLSAAAAIVTAGSYFRCYRIGPTATATLGDWS